MYIYLSIHIYYYIGLRVNPQYTDYSMAPNLLSQGCERYECSLYGIPLYTYLSIYFFIFLYLYLSISICICISISICIVVSISWFGLVPAQPRVWEVRVFTIGYSVITVYLSIAIYLYLYLYIYMYIYLSIHIYYYIGLRVNPQYTDYSMAPNLLSQGCERYECSLYGIPLYIYLSIYFFIFLYLYLSISICISICISITAYLLSQGCER